MSLLFSVNLHFSLSQFLVFLERRILLERKNRPLNSFKDVRKRQDKKAREDPQSLKSLVWGKFSKKHAIFLSFLEAWIGFPNKVLA